MPDTTNPPLTQRAYTLRLRGAQKDDTSWRDALWQTHEAVNERLETDGGTRSEIPLERLKEVLEQIDQIGDAVQAQIQDRLSRR